MIYAFISFFFVLLICLLFSRIYISITYTYSATEQYLTLRVTFLKVQMYSREIRKDKEEKDWLKAADQFISGSFSETMKETVNTLKNSTHYLLAILKSTKFHRLEWVTQGGTGDAASTGILAGSAWSVKGALIGILADNSSLGCSPGIQVIPLFQKKELTSTIDCMVSMKAGKTIIALLKAKRMVSENNKRKSQKEEQNE
ncbi:DUF2953 domain-containing protein [Virgibacillus xinjiangensis]|uniref:DUF2953 domain-containing protein n=1 Tax=Virgibacillus xinjiangensis TaxID=393090 RepID=A0ABV7CUH2_9BACI